MKNLAEKLVIKVLNNNIILDEKRLIIVGDIHGCFNELLNLLHQLNYNKKTDILISVGDLIMKGPNSIDVLNFFMNNENTFCVLGNHEYAVTRWLKYYNQKIDCLPFGLKPNSEHDIFSQKLNHQQINYLYNLPHILKLPKYNLIITHAGINPYVNFEENNSFEVMHLRNILDDLSGSELLKSGSKWIDHWNGLDTVIFGHDAVRGIQVKHNAIGLDTGCVYGKYLTCIIYPEKKIVSIPALKSYIDTNQQSLYGISS